MLRKIDGEWVEELSVFFPEDQAPFMGDAHQDDPTYKVEARYPDWDSGVTEVVYRRPFAGLVVENPKVAEAIRLIIRGLNQ